MGTIQKFILTKREFDNVERGYNLAFVPADSTNIRKARVANMNIKEIDEVLFVRANEPYRTIKRKLDTAYLRETDRKIIFLLHPTQPQK